jgi:hypothetical protein
LPSFYSFASMQPPRTGWHPLKGSAGKGKPPSVRNDEKRPNSPKSHPSGLFQRVFTRPRPLAYNLTRVMNIIGVQPLLAPRRQIEERCHLGPGAARHRGAGVFRASAAADRRHARTLYISVGGTIRGRGECIRVHFFGVGGITKNQARVDHAVHRAAGSSKDCGRN